MGKRKITNYVEIEDRLVKSVTYCKRKKGVIKKAMELSLLCAQDVMLAIYDKKKKKIVIYQSSPEFTPDQVGGLLADPATKSRHYEEYTNQSFEMLTHQRLQTYDLRLDKPMPTRKIPPVEIESGLLLDQEPKSKKLLRSDKVEAIIDTNKEQCIEP